MALLRGRLIPSKLCACLVKPWPRKIVQWLRDDIPHQNELMFEKYPNLPHSGKKKSSLSDIVFSPKLSIFKNLQQNLVNYKDLCLGNFSGEKSMAIWDENLKPNFLTFQKWWGMSSHHQFLSRSHFWFDPTQPISDISWHTTRWVFVVCLLQLPNLLSRKREGDRVMLAVTVAVM